MGDGRKGNGRKGNTDKSFMCHLCVLDAFPIFRLWKKKIMKKIELSIIYKRYIWKCIEVCESV